MAAHYETETNIADTAVRFSGLAMPNAITRFSRNCLGLSLVLVDSHSKRHGRPWLPVHPHDDSTDSRGSTMMIYMDSRPYDVSMHSRACSRDDHENTWESMESCR